MEVRELSVAGAFEVTPVQHADERGLFLEWYREDAFTGMTGGPFHVAQANCSVSNAGTLRGIHFTEVPPGQAKLVTCVQGAAFDVAVDLRVGSATYGRWDTVLIDDRERRATYLPAGFGHAFLALEDNTVVSYLCSAVHAPARDHAIHPLDLAIAVEWPTIGRDGAPLTRRLSPKDAAAPTLAEISQLGVLPTYEEAVTLARSG
jgi:dTDP-4-dehydrorhamnose 3,5-epimerase